MLRRSCQQLAGNVRREREREREREERRLKPAAGDRMTGSFPGT